MPFVSQEILHKYKDFSWCSFVAWQKHDVQIIQIQVTPRVDVWLKTTISSHMLLSHISHVKSLVSIVTQTCSIETQIH